jgi:hypothetical protein
MDRRKFLRFLGFGTVGVVAVSVVPHISANELITKKIEGPVSYYTGNTNLNPPRICCPIKEHWKNKQEDCLGCKSSWAVAKGFPRKHKII